MHIRSNTGAAELYRAQESRAWRSLWCCVAMGASVCGSAMWLHSPVGAYRGTTGTFSAVAFEPPAEAPAPAPAAKLAFTAPAAPPVNPVFEPSEAPAPELCETALLPTYDGDLPLVAVMGELPESLGGQATPRAPRPAMAATHTPQAPEEATVPPAYMDAPEPPYPPALRANRTEGTVHVRIAIDAQGTPTHVEVLGSSGHREFDSLTRNWIMRHWRFSPARTRRGTPIAATVSTRVEFRMD